MRLDGQMPGACCFLVGDRTCAPVSCIASLFTNAGLTPEHGQNHKFNSTGEVEDWHGTLHNQTHRRQLYIFYIALCSQGWAAQIWSNLCVCFQREHMRCHSFPKHKRIWRYDWWWMHILEDSGPQEHIGKEQSINKERSLCRVQNGRCGLISCSSQVFNTK